ncbi:MAG: DUF3379 family protein [Thiomicrorhabdus sp.]|jgi:hypothetical protein|nr:DUF3379 family protein [Thiomicrorhabdus sp.]
MNELAFRKQLQINSQQLDEETLDYLEQHPEQKKLVKRVRNFDTQIKEALNIQVPEGLHARILLNQSYQDAKASSAVDESNNKMDSESTNQCHSKPDTRTDKLVHFWSSARTVSWPGLSAIAASLMIVAVSIALWQDPTELKQVNGSDMVAHILDHIGEDPTLMTAIKRPTTEADMQALFATVGASLNQPIERMSYAGECVVEGQKGLHIVIQDEQGPVTVIVMPGQQLEAIQSFAASGYHGELLPVKGGVVAIVANSLEQVALAQMRFFKAVRFT